MATYLHRLPIGLEQTIIHYLNLNSLLHFRLVNKHFYEVSLSVFQHHFQEVKATWSVAGIRNLLPISKSPLLRSVVDNIWIDVYISHKSHPDHDLQYDFDNHALGSPLLTLAISNFHKCTNIRITTAQGVSPGHRKIGDVLVGSNEGLTVLSIDQHAFDLCERPLRTLSLQFAGELIYIHAHKSTTNTLTRPWIYLDQCEDFARDDGYPESGVLQFILVTVSLEWLCVKSRDVDSLEDF